MNSGAVRSKQSIFYTNAVSSCCLYRQYKLDNRLSKRCVVGCTFSDDLKMLIHISDVSQKVRYSASTVSKSNKHFSAVFRLPYQPSILETNDSYRPPSINKYVRCSIFCSFHPSKTSTAPSLPVLIARIKRHKATALAVTFYI